eukprot:2483438-Prymnesium_polylepis.2
MSAIACKAGEATRRCVADGWMRTDADVMYTESGNGWAGACPLPVRSSRGGCSALLHPRLRSLGRETRSKGL